MKITVTFKERNDLIYEYSWSPSLFFDADSDQLNMV